MPLGRTDGSVNESRLAPDEPSPTIVSGNSTPPVNYSGDDPSEVRRLTVRECARLQSFPDEHVFVGGKQEQYRQVGNAVPPRLQFHIAQHLRDVALLTDGGTESEETLREVFYRLNSGDYLRVPRNGMPDYIHFGWDQETNQLLHRVGRAPLGSGTYAENLLEWLWERRSERFEFVDSSETLLNQFDERRHGGDRGAE